MKIKFFWVWTALQPNIKNTHFLIEDWDDKLQVDASWWLSFAQKVKRKELEFDNIFLTHTHTDHFLWFFNLLRVIKKLNVYCSVKVENDIRVISKIVLNKNWNNKLDNGNIKFFYNDDLKVKEIWNFKITPINLNSKKVEQYWFLLEINNKKILFFWDEAVWILDRNDLDIFVWVDYLICEWLIPEYQSKKYWWEIDLLKMSHISARETWRIATKFKAKNLIIIHTKEIENRIDELKNDAKLEFNWNIIVPNDSDEIELI